MTQLPPELAAALAANPDLARVNPGLVVIDDVSNLTKEQWEILANKPKRGKPEDDFQQQIIDLAHLNGWRVAHFRSVKVTRSDGSTYWQTPVQADGAGWLDLALARECLIFAEVKAENGKPTAEQMEWIKVLKATGAEVYVWRPSDWPEIERRLAKGE